VRENTASKLYMVYENFVTSLLLVCWLLGAYPEIFINRQCLYSLGPYLQERWQIVCRLGKEKIPPRRYVGVMEKISFSGDDIPPSCNPPINGTLNKLSILSVCLSFCFLLYGCFWLWLRNWSEDIKPDIRLMNIPSISTDTDVELFSLCITTVSPPPLLRLLQFTCILQNNFGEF
jgi:hypothetical protein